MTKDPIATIRRPLTKPFPETITHTRNHSLIGNSTSAESSQSYIEKDFPVERLTPVVTKEANSKKPIYQMHKWWARRLGSVFRMLLVTSFSGSEESQCDIWAKYVGFGALRGKVVLDPMMGGGTSIVETLKLGGKAIGIDINPVAWFVTKKEVEPLDQTEVQKNFKMLESEVGSVVKKFYETKCPDGHNAEIMYALWHKQIYCGNCRSQIIVLQNYVISEKDGEMVIFCPSCKSVFRKGRNVRTSVACSTCGYEFNPRMGTSRKGRIICPHCGHKETIIDEVRRKGGPLDLKLFCIEYYCKECGRGYKRPEHEDIQLYRKAETVFSELHERLPYPKEAIPDNPNNPRPKNHGYRFFYQLFNHRQLLCLALLLEGILKIRNRDAREFLLLVFSSCLETNNIFCKYETKWQKISAMFSLPAYHPVDRVAENNVWGVKYGRGTFLKCYHKMLRAKILSKEHNRDQALEAKNNENWFTHVARSFSDLKNSDRNALLVCKNSESMSFVPKKSVDLIATDPPYFDNLNYSRLADFFYVWLRIGLMKDYDCFKPKTSSRERELIIDGSTSRTASDLVESLTSIFKECNRVLKPNRPIVFTFHHTKEWAWQGLMKAIRSAGFSIVASHFIRSEGRTGFRKNGNISYDVCMVCKKIEEAMIKEEPRLAINRSKKWVRRLVHSGNGLQDSDIHSIVMGNLLTYTPNLVLNGFEQNKWVSSVLKKCMLLKSELEGKHANLSNTIPRGR